MNASEFRKKAEHIFKKYSIKNSRFLDSQRAEKIKCNFYFDTPEDCLNELEEYLSNMLWINQPEERQKEIDKIYIS